MHRSCIVNFVAPRAINKYCYGDECGLELDTGQYMHIAAEGESAVDLQRQTCMRQTCIQSQNVHPGSKARDAHQTCDFGCRSWDVGSRLCYEGCRRTWNVGFRRSFSDPAAICSPRTCRFHSCTHIPTPFGFHSGVSSAIRTPVPASAIRVSTQKDARKHSKYSILFFAVYRGTSPIRNRAPP